MDNKFTLLIVDDEILVLKSLTRVLDDFEGVILQAQSGQEALELLDRNDVDILLSDNQMPGMTGLELLETVKTLYPKIICLMMTGYADLQTAVEAINRGHVYKFIVKPWDNDKLAGLIQEAVVRVQESGSS